MERDGARFDELIERNGRLRRSGDRITEAAQLLEVAFVGFVALPQHRPVAGPDQLLEIVHQIRFAVPEVVTVAESG